MAARTRRWLTRTTLAVALGAVPTDRVRCLAARVNDEGTRGWSARPTRRDAGQRSTVVTITRSKELDE
jgi:hypothetical protein